MSAPPGRRAWTSQVVIVRHMVKNAMIPVWTVLGPLAAGLITGSFIVERIFRHSGHRAASSSIAIGSRDYSMIMGTTLVYTVFNRAGNSDNRRDLRALRPADQGNK